MPEITPLRHPEPCPPSIGTGNVPPPDLFDAWPAPMAAVTTPQPPPGAPPQPFPQSPPEYPDNVPPEIEEPAVPGENQPMRDPQGPPPDIIALH